MKLMTIDINKIYNVDCVKGMKEIPDEEIDLVIEDGDIILCDRGNEHGIQVFTITVEK